MGDPLLGQVPILLIVSRSRCLGYLAVAVRSVISKVLVEIGLPLLIDLL